MLYIKDGKFYQGSVVLGELRIINPSKEQILKAGYVEYIPKPSEPYAPTYEEQIILLIREKYTIEAEIAILRQKDTKPEEFAEYNIFIEGCKAQVKTEQSTKI